MLAVTGGRDYQDREKVFTVLDDLRREHAQNIQLILGDATGADTLAKQWAADRKVIHSVHYADWKQFGKAAGPIRNGEMVRRADYLIAFPGGRGTENCIQQALNIPIPVRRVL